MTTFVGLILFVLLNIIFIPITSLFMNGWLFYLGSILTFVQIIIGFSVIYGIIIKKITNYGGDDEHGFK